MSLPVCLHGVAIDQFCLTCSESARARRAELEAAAAASRDPVSLSILQEAQALIHGDRQATYGHPRDNLGRIARLWSVVLGVDVTPEQVCLCMVQVKIARQVHRPKRDNLVDAAGYLALDELLGAP